MVLKCFFDHAAVGVERSAYNLLRERCVAADHYLGAARFAGRPTFVMHCLARLDWSGDGWAVLLERAIATRRALSQLTLPLPRRSGPIPVVGTDELLSPLRAWLRKRGNVSGVVRRLATRGHPPAPLEICHGDFHPPNVMEGADGGLRLVDWERCAWSPPDRDLAAVTVGTALRQPAERFCAIAEATVAHSRDRRLFAALLTSEIVALLEVFADSPGRTHTLDCMLETFIDHTLREWSR